MSETPFRIVMICVATLAIGLHGVSFSQWHGKGTDGISPRALPAERYALQDFWIPLPAPSTRTLNRLCFLDSLRGWVAGDSGTILRTVDGGYTWRLQDAGTPGDLVDISMINEQFGWALAVQPSVLTHNILLKTTDGGNEWTSLPSPVPDRTLFTVRFLDSLHGWTGGTAGTLVGTTDGGQTWFRPQVDSTIYNGYQIFNMRFLSPGFGYAMGGVLDLGGILWRTTNGGQRWTPARSAGSPIYDLCFADSLDAILVSGEYDLGVGVGTTTDGGMHWDYRDLGVYGEGRSVSFRTRAEGWICSGYAGTYLCTFDSGRTWSESFAPDSSTMNDVKFTDARHGFMVGAHGTILRYNSSLLEVRDFPPSSSSFRLYANYPNPCNPSTVIPYQISERSHVVLSVYDLLGREVATLVNRDEDPGYRSVPFNPQNVASGIYFYRLSVSPFEEQGSRPPGNPDGIPYIQTRKLVVIR